MKKIYGYFFAAVAIASAASCAEQMDDSSSLGTQSAPADFAEMTISASLGDITKTSYDNQNVLWEGNESITVFSKGSEDKPEAFEMAQCSADKASAVFTGLADLNAEAYYAVYPHSAANACTADGVLTVNIPAEQTAVAGGFASGANVSVAAWKNADLSSDDNVIFNNVCTLLSFGFETDADAILTKSVTIKVKKNATEYYGIAGNVAVSYDAKGDLLVSEGSVQSIVLNAPEGGFAKGMTYYVTVAPVGNIAEMELLYTHTDGTTACTRKNSNIVASLTRSTLVPLETIPVAYDDLPQEDFEVVFDFTGDWPLMPACLSSNLQNAQDDGGDTYTYSYQYGDNKTLSLTTTFLRGASDAAKRIGYVHENGVLMFAAINTSGTYNDTNSSGFLSIPSIEGRYIASVILELGTFRQDYNSYSAPLEFHYMGTKDKILGLKSEVVAVNNAIITLNMPYNDKGGQLGEWVNIKFRGANIPVKKVKMTYSKNK